MILPDDLYDYAHDRPHRDSPSHHNSEDGSGADRIAVIDDWPDDIPVTEAEVDVFERYFGDLLDRLLGAIDPAPKNQGLHKLTSGVNDKP
ncbi:MAG: hypothetical protein U5M50_15600 [Sphingobium sp.]|nr:hypothetical protein [Sphingobium sp.]